MSRCLCVVGVCVLVLVCDVLVGVLVLFLSESVSESVF